jgi:hypothetical protein
MRYPILKDTSIVTQEFLQGSISTTLHNPTIEFIGDGKDINLDKVVSQFTGLTKSDKEPPSTDGEMAAFIHQELKLPRYIAANHAFWQYIAVVKCPEYVA